MTERETHIAETVLALESIHKPGLHPQGHQAGQPALGQVTG